MSATIDRPIETRIEKPREKPGLVTFGKAGHSVYYHHNAKEGSKSHESGYDDPETFFAPSKWWAHDYMTQRDAASWEGVPWVNMRKAVETEAGYRHVFKGPMVDVDLQPGQVDRLGEVSELFACAVAENDFGKLLALQMAHNAASKAAGPLDSVDVAEYCRLWKAAGASVGVIRNGQFVEL